MKLNEDERIEDLQCDGLKIIQNKKLYTFTSDSVVLANFIGLKSKEKCVEIGTGSGVISLLLCKKTKFDFIYAFELQKEMSDLAQKNIELNKLDDKIQIINDDILNFGKYIKNGEIDVVFSNPPYMKESQQNENSVKAIARHDKSLPIDKLCKVSSQMLKSGGAFYVVYSSQRAAELIYNLKQNKLEPKTIFFTENGKGKTILIVVKAVKDGKEGVEVLPTLVTNDKEGKYLEILHTKYIK